MADLLLFGVTAVELVVLFPLTPTFTIADWIYVLQHLVVLGIALTRPSPTVRDYSIASSTAVIIAYAYPYAQVICLRGSPGYVAWPGGGLALVIFAAGLSLVTLLTLGRLFGVRPAVRGLATRGRYRFVRHPMYLSYILADIGYNLQEWNFVTLLLVWSVGRLSSTASMPRSEYSFSIADGQVTLPRSALGFSPVFGEAPLPLL